MVNVPNGNAAGSSLAKAAAASASPLPPVANKRTRKFAKHKKKKAPPPGHLSLGRWPVRVTCLLMSIKEKKLPIWQFLQKKRGNAAGSSLAKAAASASPLAPVVNKRKKSEKSKVQSKEFFQSKKFTKQKEKLFDNHYCCHSRPARLQTRLQIINEIN